MMFSIQGEMIPLSEYSIILVHTPSDTQHLLVLLYAELINGDDLTLGFIRVNDLNCLECVELNGGKEFLLCFHSKPLFHLMHT